MIKALKDPRPITKVIYRVIDGQVEAFFPDDVEDIIQKRLGRASLRMTPEEDRKQPNYGAMTPEEFAAVIAKSPPPT
jgi:hypothetical protein